MGWREVTFSIPESLLPSCLSTSSSSPTYPLSFTLSYSSSSHQKRASAACALLLLLCSCLLATAFAAAAADDGSRQGVIRVGCLASFNTTVGDEILSAVRIAAEEINADHKILDGTFLDFIFLNSSEGTEQALAATMQGMEHKLMAMIGPMTSTQAHVITCLGTGTQTPFISYSATDPTLSSRAQYPYLSRTIRSDELEMKAVTDLVSYFNWLSVIAIYSDDDYGRNGIDELGLSLEQASIDLTARLLISLDASEEDVVNVLLSAQKLESTVFVGHLSLPLVPVVLSAASSLGMMTAGYIWILTEGALSIVPSLSSDMFDAVNIEGIIGTKSHVPPSPKLNSFMSKWEKLDPDDYPGAGQEMINLYSLFAYDAVYLLAKALHDLINDSSFFNVTQKNPFPAPSSPLLPENGGGTTALGSFRVNQWGTPLRNRIYSTTFEGVTGKVIMSADGDRIGSIFEIINVVAGDLRPVGYWSQTSGLSATPEIDLSVDLETFTRPTINIQNPVLSSIIWPGGVTYLPRGWSPKSHTPIRLAVPDKKDFTQFVQVTSSGVFTGFCVEVFKAAVELLPYALDYDFVPYGTGNLSLSYTDMLIAVSNEEFDGAVGDITVTSARTALVDFTQPFQSSSLTMVVAMRPVGSSDQWSFLIPFTYDMWAVFVAATIFTAIVMWFLERNQNKEFYAHGNFLSQAIDSIWFASTTIVFAQDKNVQTALGRLTMIVWLFVVLIVTSSYTASLSSILTVQNLQPTPKSLTIAVDRQMSLGYHSGSFTHRYLLSIGIPDNLLTPLGNIQEYADAMNKAGLKGIIDEAPYLEVFTSKYCDFSMLTEDISNFNWGFAFQKGSRLAFDLSTALAKLAENGQLQSLHDFWIKGSGSCSTGPSVEADQLGPDKFWTLFAVYGAISALCCFLFLTILLIRGFRLLKSGIDVNDTTVVGDLDDKASEQQQEARKNVPLNFTTMKKALYLGVAWSKVHHHSMGKVYGEKCAMPDHVMLPNKSSNSINSMDSIS